MHFLFILILQLVINFAFAQTRVWIEDSTEYIPPKPSIGWDSLESLIIYPEIYNRAGIEQSIVIIVFINSQGKIDSIDNGEMYQGFIQFVDSTIYSTKSVPGKFKGVTIDTSITIPITFKSYDGENAPPIYIISERKLERGHWEYLSIEIDTNLVQIPPERPENFSFIFKWWTYRDSLYLNTSDKFLKSKHR